MQSICTSHLDTYHDFHYICILEILCHWQKIKLLFFIGICVIYSKHQDFTLISINRKREFQETGPQITCVNFFICSLNITIKNEFSVAASGFWNGGGGNRKLTSYSLLFWGKWAANTPRHPPPPPPPVPQLLTLNCKLPWQWPPKYVYL